jgi:hypothetical protein
MGRFPSYRSTRRSRPNDSGRSISFNSHSSAPLIRTQCLWSFLPGLTRKSVSLVGLCSKPTDAFVIVAHPGKKSLESLSAFDREPQIFAVAVTSENSECSSARSGPTPACDDSCHPSSDDHLRRAEDDHAAFVKSSCSQPEQPFQGWILPRLSVDSARHSADL